MGIKTSNQRRSMKIAGGLRRPSCACPPLAVRGAPSRRSPSPLASQKLGVVGDENKENKTKIRSPPQARLHTLAAQRCKAAVAACRPQKLAVVVGDDNEENKIKSSTGMKRTNITNKAHHRISHNGPTRI
jgi:hypothetical protein